MFNIKIKENQLNIDLGYGTFTKGNSILFFITNIIMSLIGISFIFEYLFVGITSESTIFLSQILLIIIILMFSLTGVSKLFAVQKLQEQFAYYRIPIWFMKLTGIFELIGVIVLVLGFFNNILFVIGGFFLSSIMVGAVFTHVFRVNDNKWPLALLLMYFAGYVGLINLLRII